jgi:desulfoferrodoxin (superoxide reductase-like protein)
MAEHRGQQEHVQSEDKKKKKRIPCIEKLKVMATVAWVVDV